ncbi:MAG: LodA/GoxA family CTQ-dependent oxidase [Bacteroidota bacterium]
MNISDVHSVAIYPPIGVARVGNSPNEYFLGSIIPGIPAQDPDDFRDTQGRIKRQGAKYFIFGLDAEGNILGELNDSHGVKIDWRVDVANKKAAWYDFDIALDTPTAEGVYDMDGNLTPDGPPVMSKKRNLDFEGEDRKLLMIEARAQRIEGVNKNTDGTSFHLKGKIGRKQTEVYMGELRTDELGRLIFLGGRGHSSSFTDPKSPLVTFANNQGWHDDTSDGPVDAAVTLPDGRTLEAKGAWVLTAPPNFAVGVQAFSTGYDLLVDVAAQKHPQYKKEVPEFYRDIYPTLKHLSINEWVNAGVSREFGFGSGYDFGSEAFVERLKDPSEQNRPFRQVIFESFRNPDYQKIEPRSWPPLYGDAITFNINSINPRNFFAITPLVYGYLKQWAEGDFLVGSPQRPTSWEEMTPAEQAHGLTEAALEETLGGPFHPGCEFTWPMRHAMMYQDDQPFRLKRRDNAKEDFGATLDYKIALAPGGPLDGCSPGDVTKWMAVPWQSDTSSCLSAYRTYAGEYLPTFWPARVPNDVLTEEDFAIINDEGADPNTRIAAFSPDRRKKWLRGYIFNDEGAFLYGSSIEGRRKGILKFTEEWPKIGIIVQKEIATPSPLFPKAIWVETGRTIESKPPFAARGTASESITETVSRPKWVDINPRLLR